MRARVLVLCGGRSAEREVSLVSAKTVIENLDPRRYAPLAALIAADGRWRRLDPRRLPARVGRLAHALARRSPPLPPLQRLAIDVVFPVLHGPLGEDGTLQGLLEQAGLPYVGCGVLSSAAAMDKEATKILAGKAGLPQLPYAVARRPEDARGLDRRLGLPLFVKPARLGSSVGVSKVKRPGALAAAVRKALRYDDKALVEKGLDAREVECAVLGDPWSRDPKDPLRLAASVCGEVSPNAEFYTYESKYLDPNGARVLVPAPIPSALQSRLRELALRAFRALDGYGLARVDFLLERRTSRPYFNEINTLPGFTSGSMYPMMWRQSGLATPRLLDRLIALALRRHAARSRLKTTP